MIQLLQIVYPSKFGLSTIPVGILINCDSNTPKVEEHLYALDVKLKSILWTTLLLPSDQTNKQKQLTTLFIACDPN